jgi:hypothetical protein
VGESENVGKEGAPAVSELLAACHTVAVAGRAVPNVGGVMLCLGPMDLEGGFVG